ncbi:hypothetical protein [Riemerella columbina]|uniref:hypothetical protein n=1 Tax=Riemerella columbina TaxID=103810 RepID=UPI000367F0B3|nr:hypothetical protein [Riemerella columbina]
MTQKSNLALGLKPTAYSQNIAALSLAFFAMGCSPVLIFFKLCVIYLGAGRFLCALSRKPKAVGKSIDFRNKSLEIRYWKALCRRLNTSGNHSSLKTHHLSLAVGKRLRALYNNSLLATGNLKQLVQLLVAGFSPVATKQINY